MWRVKVRGVEGEGCGVWRVKVRDVEGEECGG